MPARKFVAMTYHVTCDDHPWFATQSLSEDFVDARLREHNDLYHREIKEEAA